MNQYDVSQLPAPTLIEPLDFEAAFEVVKADFLKRCPQFDALVESDPAMKLLESFAYALMDRIHKDNEKAKQTMLSFATGTNLDQIAGNTVTLRQVIVEADPDAEPPITAIYESDRDFRTRAQNAPERFTVAGPVAAYNALTRDSDGLVRDAQTQAHTPEAGSVTVTILSHDHEGLASPELCAKVSAYLSADERRPCCDTVYVQPAELIDIDIKVALVFYAGADQKAAMALALQNLETYATDLFRINTELTLSAIHDQARVGGVHKVIVLSPNFDATEIIKTNAHEALRCRVSIEKGGVYEP